MSKKSILFLAVGIVLVATLVILTRGKKERQDFELAEASKTDIEVKITATGGVQAQNRLEIKPPLAGRIEKVLYPEGVALKKGTVIAWMSSSERVALIDSARARGPEELKRWEELYRQTPILAPLTGILIARRVEPGQTVTLNDVVMVMSNRLIVRADVDETDIAKIKVGLKASINLDAYSKESFPGRVDHIAYDAKTVNNVTVYSIDILPEVAPEFMRSGMSANVRFNIDRKEGVVAVRSDAVKTEGENKFVLVPGEGKGAEPKKVPVTTGATDGKLVEITDGLHEGDTILIPKFKPLAKKEGGSNPFMPFSGSGGSRGGGGGRGH